MLRLLTFSLTLFCFTSGFVNAKSCNTVNSSAHYLANEGLMVVQDETKVLFDPLFSNTYGQYQRLPKPMEEAIFAGTPPFDGIDAVFISHYHGDHFSPADILRLLKTQPGIHLYAPAQAVKGMREEAGEHEEGLFKRVTEVKLAYKETPLTLHVRDLLIEAVRIPHSGWPTGRLDVENISWRVTLDECTTVLHMGDADPNDIHFSRDAEFWSKSHTHMAFPPYWFFDSTYGNGILEKHVRADHNVGVHVPVSMPDEPERRPIELRDFDLFTRPGEIRQIPVARTVVEKK